MDIINKFLYICGYGNVIEVNRMISEGLDVNSLGKEGVTGLMGAMHMNNTEVSRILLGCNNIKIDIKNSHGWTALHAAGYKNSIECVKLFLEHPTCNKDIVKIKDNDGKTAEMVADRRGNHKCAKLIREYLKNNDVEYYAKSVDDLVEFITGGGTEKKKKKEKRKNPTESAVKSDITGHSGVNETEKGIKHKTKEDSDNLGEGIIDTIAKADIEKHPKIIILKDAPESNAKHANLKKYKEKLEEKIAEKCLYFDKHKENVKEMINTKSIEIKNIDSMIEKSQDEKNIKLNQVIKLDKELSDLETKIAKLRMKKTELLEESKVDDRKIEKYEEKKQKLEGVIEQELKRSKEKGNTIKDEIQDLETRLQETNMLIQNPPYDDKLSCEPNKELLEFIENQIIEKEKELECPVCLEVACSPIFMCSEQHLICSSCRPKLSSCPECRVVYSGKNRRHRYAEKTAEELEKLKNKKDSVKKIRVSADLITSRLG